MYIIPSEASEEAEREHTASGKTFSGETAMDVAADNDGLSEFRLDDYDEDEVAMTATNAHEDDDQMVEVRGRGYTVIIFLQ